MDDPAMTRVCRMCLDIDVKMYDLNGHKLRQIFKEVTGIPISETDKLPQRLCWECTQRLVSAHSLRRKALRAHKLLLDMLNSEKFITMQHVQSINRCNYQLDSTLSTHYSNLNIELNTTEIKVEVLDPKMEHDDFDIHIDEVYDNNETSNDETDVPLEVKVETNEIFLDECSFVSEDDETLGQLSKENNKERSEVRAKKEVTVKKTVTFKKSIEKVKKKATGKKSEEKVNEKVSVQNSKERVKEKVSVQNSEEKEKEAADVNGSEKKRKIEDIVKATVDRIKTSGVRRLRKTENLDKDLFTIINLTYEEQIEEVNKRRETSSYLNAAHKCDVCFKGFRHRARYEVHAVRHSVESGAFECFICKTRLKTGPALRHHVVAQHTEQFDCKSCPFVSKSRSVARQHQKWHAGTKFQCPHCPVEFDKISTYLGHVRIKHASDFVCELCGFTFVNKKGVVVHKNKKHRLSADSLQAPLQGPYCEVCDVKFASDEAHARHLKVSLKHSSDSDPNRIRNDSQSLFSVRGGAEGRRRDRRLRANRRHAADVCDARPVEIITCEQCGVQLSGPRLYAQHFRRVHPDKNRTKFPATLTPTMCEQCGRIFQSKGHLRDHMWAHTGEKHFKCDHCDKSFKYKPNLSTHMRVHNSVPPTFECPVCAKHFTFENNRKRHMLIHTGVKPFKCESCCKAYTSSGELRIHIQHVHLKKPWPKRKRRRAGDDTLKCDLESMED